MVIEIPSSREILFKIEPLLEFTDSTCLESTFYTVQLGRILTELPLWLDFISFVSFAILLSPNATMKTVISNLI